MSGRAALLLAIQKGRLVLPSMTSLCKLYVLRWKEETAELEAAFKNADVNGDGKVY